jgi:hypothetical protein
MREETDTTAPVSRPVAASGPSLLPISIGQAVVIFGAVLIVGSLFLNWLDIHVAAGGRSASATGAAAHVPVQFLFNKHETETDPTILVVLIPAVVIGAFAALMRSRWAVLLAGIVSLFVAGMYAYQVDRFLGDLTDQTNGLVHFGLGDVMGVAPYVCGAGATLMLGGAFLLGHWPEPDTHSNVVANSTLTSKELDEPNA